MPRHWPVHHRGVQGPHVWQQGEKNPLAKYTDEQVNEVLDLWYKTSMLQSEIAALTGVHRSQVSKIICGKSRNPDKYVK